MIGVKVSVAAKRLHKQLRLIQTKDIPAAKASAFKRAGKTGTSKAATMLAASLGVQKWMINGQKGKGGRFGQSKYIKKLDGVVIHFRTKNINPAGTSRKPSRVSTTRRGVRAQKRMYPGAFVKNYRHFPSIYTPEGNGLRLETIEITPGHVGQVKRSLRKTVPVAFRKRFDHELKRRLKRRGAR